MAEDRERDSSAHLEDSRNERTSQEDMGPAMTIILERQTVRWCEYRWINCIYE